MRAIAGAILFLLVMLPLATLFHRDDLGHWTASTRHGRAGRIFLPADGPAFPARRGAVAQGGTRARHLFSAGLSAADRRLDQMFFAGKLTAFAAHALNTASSCAWMFSWATCFPGGCWCFCMGLEPIGGLLFPMKRRVDRACYRRDFCRQLACARNIAADHERTGVHAGHLCVDDPGACLAAMGSKRAASWR